MPLLVLKFFATGLIENAVRALAGGDASCGLGCLTLAALIMLLLAGFLVVSLLMLCRFYAGVRKAQMWSAAEKPQTTDEVDDPLLRLLHRCCRCVRVARRAGDFQKPDDHAEEPARTARLVRSPLRVSHLNTGDLHDALSMVWLTRASGGGVVGVSYDYVALVAQMTIAALSSIPSDPSQPDSYWPFAQAILVGCLQIGFATYVSFLIPSIDFVENLVTGLQFLLEGTCTVLLVTAASPDVEEELAGTLQLIAFFFAASSVLLPVLLKVYDGLLRPILIDWRQTGKLSIGCGACCSTLAAIPTILGGVFGFNMGSTDIEGLVDEGMGVVENAKGEAVEEEGREQGKKGEEEKKKEEPATAEPAAGPAIESAIAPTAVPGSPAARTRLPPLPRKTAKVAPL